MPHYINPKAYSKLKKKLQTCALAIEQIEAADNYEAFSDAWVNLIMAGGTIFSTLEQACKFSPQGKQWWGSVAKKSRRKDPLVLYMVQARNAEEHGIEPVTKIDPGGIGIGVNAPKGDTVRIESLTIENGKINLGSTLPKNLTTGEDVAWKIDFIPATFRIVDVMDTRYGSTFSPPIEHKGEPIIDNSPTVTAKLYAEFLHELVEKTKRIT